MTSSENDEINWRSEHFRLFHEYDILVDKYVARGKKIKELQEVIAQHEEMEVIPNGWLIGDVSAYQPPDNQGRTRQC